ncbi:hypothetical protein BD410DRAFT_840771 [Rickenella mellea]|uniref:Uncharacterized protein n=1 Tax=Rickenella mellea TaxID=50990 RepID=A0A4Y7Q2F8_9AGAM|nr:hypothetical protein BD410DRAFT_840771 [Rickenella mellea]
MSIDPGAYEIRNIMHGNFAVQHGGTVVASAHPDVQSMGGSGSDLERMWSISHLNNDKYTIRNMETNHYASSPSFPAMGENIITTQALQQWAIKETGVKGRHVIYTTAADIELFWGLANGLLKTPISLRDIPNTPSNQWELIKVDLWRVVGKLRAPLAGLRDEHKTLQSEHQKIRDEHTKLQGERMRLQDELTKLQDIHTKLNADAWQEKARHVQNESELRAFVERRFRRDEARHLQAEAELRESYERAIRQERARHIQAEAETKAYYEELLAERDQATNQRRLREALVSSSVNVISANGGGIVEAPQPSHEPTRTAFSHTTPTLAQAKRPTMTPAPTTFSSTAASYYHAIHDEDESVHDPARLFARHQDPNDRGEEEKVAGEGEAVDWPILSYG